MRELFAEQVRYYYAPECECSIQVQINHSEENHSFIDYVERWAIATAKKEGISITDVVLKYFRHQDCREYIL